ncbi:hypothetical protein HMPREF3116_06735 [Aerococcus sp. HMSC10H05]|nr:hypothetical protein HMPREF3116_06735 [Aerococcus sp. HMSC10H05]
MLSLAYINQTVTDLQSFLFNKLINNTINFDEMTKLTEKSLNELIVEMVQSVLSDVEEVIRESSDRKQNYWIHRSNDLKVIATKFGDIEYSRAYYRNKTTDNFTYLLDDLLEIEPHQRIDNNLQSQIIENAKDMSYQQAIDKIENISIHSKQTTYNLVHKLSRESIELPLEETIEKRTPQYLYIEADEDHVAMQDSSNKQMKLVYVQTGFNHEKSTDKRHVLNIERCFTGWYPNNDELWLEVSAFIEETYDTQNIKQIFLSGDGASWIKSGVDYLPANTTFVLDPFHTKQATVRSVVGLGPKAKETLGLLRRWIRFNQKGKVKRYFDPRLSDPDLSSSEKKALEANRKYLLNHWTAIQNQYRPGYISCSAEGHVSHILSSRLSSRPLGWSIKGAENIAKLRVYKLNGGQIDQLVLLTNKQKQKERKVIQLDDRITGAKKAEYTAIHNGSIVNYGSSSSPLGVLKRTFS